MRSTRPVLGIAALVILVTVVGACGGSAASSAPSAAASVGAGPGDVPSDPIVASPQPGTGTGTTNPPISVGTFTSGKVHADVSGVVTETLDFDLVGGQTISGADATIFTFTDGGTAAVAIGITNEGNTLSVSTAQLSVAGGTFGADSNQCAIVVTKSDAGGVAGTFDCKDLLAVYDNLSKNGNVNVTGTFEANR